MTVRYGRTQNVFATISYTRIPFRSSSYLAELFITPRSILYIFTQTIGDFKRISPGVLIMEKASKRSRKDGRNKNLLEMTNCIRNGEWLLKHVIFIGRTKIRCAVFVCSV